MIPPTRKAFVVWTNTDLTEGRGAQVPLAVCAIRATADRVASGRYVMGTDAPIKAMDLIMVNGQWFGPVHIIEPTHEDTADQAVIDRRLDAIEKARTAGLSDGDLRALGVEDLHLDQE